MASGDTLLVFTPLSNEPPAAGFASLDSRNLHPVLDFALSEVGVFSFVVPRHYAGGGLTVYIHYSMQHDRRVSVRASRRPVVPAPNQPPAVHLYDRRHRQLERHVRIKHQ